jgi:hypothetical protein
MTLPSDESIISYSPELLSSIEQAFKSVWETLNAHMPVSGDVANERQARLSRIIISLAADGITDPAVLRREALSMMKLDPP